MSRITYNAEMLKIMGFFEKVTRTRLKDAFYDETDMLTFVVDDAFLGKAIGKKAANVKKLEQSFKKKIRILGYNKDLGMFVKNLIHPATAQIVVEDTVVTIKSQDHKTKGSIIGRNRSGLKKLTSIINKYFKDITIQVQ